MFHFKRPFALDKRWVGHYFSAMIASEPKADPAKRGASYSYLENGTHLTAGTDGILRSKVLPGLWLDVRALLARDGAKMMEALQAGLKSTEHAAFVNTLSEESHRSR